MLLNIKFRMGKEQCPPEEEKKLLLARYVKELAIN